MSFSSIFRDHNIGELLGTVSITRLGVFYSFYTSVKYMYSQQTCCMYDLMRIDGIILVLNLLWTTEVPGTDTNRVWNLS